MPDRRTFFGQVLAFIAGINIFGSKIEKAESATIPKDEPLKVNIGSASFVETVQKYLPKDFFSEWALQVDQAEDIESVDATTFANMFLEMLRNPENYSETKACTVFATLMKTRSWAEIQDLLKDSIDSNLKDVFRRPEAEEFYKQFKAMILEQIREYWEHFLESRQNKEDDSAGASSSN